MILDYPHGPNLTTRVLKSREAFQARSRERAVTALEGSEGCNMSVFQGGGQWTKECEQKTPENTLLWASRWDSAPLTPSFQAVRSSSTGNPIQNQMLLPVLRPVRVPFPAAPMGGTFIPLKYVTFQISYLQTPLNQPMRGQWPLLHIVT